MVDTRLKNKETNNHEKIDNRKINEKLNFYKGYIISWSIYNLCHLERLKVHPSIKFHQIYYNKFYILCNGIHLPCYDSFRITTTSVMNITIVVQMILLAINFILWQFSCGISTNSIENW